MSKYLRKSARQDGTFLQSCYDFAHLDKRARCSKDFTEIRYVTASWRVTTHEHTLPQSSRSTHAFFLWLHPQVLVPKNDNGHDFYNKVPCCSRFQSRTLETAVSVITIVSYSSASRHDTKGHLHRNSYLTFRGWKRE